MASPESGACAGGGTSRIRSRRRLAAAVAAAVTVGAGLGLRAAMTGDVAKYGGDALYTLLIVALVVLVAPSVTARKAAAVALALSWGVEFLQLSGVPAELSRHSVAARLVLGSTFGPQDLLWYTVGALGGWGLVAWSRRPVAGRAVTSRGRSLGR
ncbi:DUF2809 domain-containing protein [Streptomyces abyssomicinicus]|uniref:ribosomal maturation YjgA family protein n=1 Tax=Streptomyces abyssomicinicus TaxID=574929 RepID=UPI001250CB78|nr:DUF2809 domain-containing protein [Streptomyces abyssomicinicus]